MIKKWFKKEDSIGSKSDRQLSNQKELQIDEQPDGKPMKTMNQLANAVLFNPSIVIAGVSPVGPRGRRIEPAFQMLAATLDDERVKFVVSEYQDKLYYLGIRERDLTVPGIACTTLSQALPGKPGHQGEAAYITQSGEITTVVIFKDGALLCKSGSADDMSRFIENAGVKTVQTDPSLAEPWDTDIKLTRYNLRKIARAAVLCNAVAALVFSITWGASAGVYAWAKPSELALSSELQSMLTKVATDFQNAKKQPIYNQMNAIYPVQDLAENNKGRVVFFKQKSKNEQPVWKIELPIFTPSRIFESLTRDVQVVEMSPFIQVTNEKPGKADAKDAPKIKLGATK